MDGIRFSIVMSILCTLCIIANIYGFCTDQFNLISLILTICVSICLGGYTYRIGRHYLWQRENSIKDWKI